jgi:hypothetical protein
MIKKQEAVGLEAWPLCKWDLQGLRRYAHALTHEFWGMVIHYGGWALFLSVRLYAYSNVGRHDSGRAVGMEENTFFCGNETERDDMSSGSFVRTYFVSFARPKKWRSLVLSVRQIFETVFRFHERLHAVGSSRRFPLWASPHRLYASFTFSHKQVTSLRSFHNGRRSSSTTTPCLSEDSRQ